MIYPDQRYISLIDWATGLIKDFPQVTVARFFEPWEDWASTVIQIPFFAAYAPPQPRFYKTWDAWARDFYRVVNFATS